MPRRAPALRPCWAVSSLVLVVSLGILVSQSGWQRLWPAAAAAATRPSVAIAQAGASLGQPARAALVLPPAIEVTPDNPRPERGQAHTPVPTATPVLDGKPETPLLDNPLSVSTDADGVTLVQLGVPYINQLYDTDNAFNGSCACGPVSLAMVLAYYGRIGAKPMTVNVPYPHYSQYGWAVTDSTYSYGDRTFDREITECERGPLSFGGLYGALMVDDYNTMTEWARMTDAIAAHALGITEYDAEELSFDVLKGAIDRGHPVILTQMGLTGVGHVIVVVGYTSHGRLIVNDSYGSKWNGYPNFDGAGVWYKWPEFGWVGHAWEVSGPPEGWTAAYKTGQDVPQTRYDRDLSFDWGTQAVDFSATWTRNLTFAAGQATFNLTTDGAARILVDGSVVLDHAGAAGQPEAYAAVVPVKAGQHEVRVEYHHLAGGPAVAQLEIKR